MTSPDKLGIATRDGKRRSEFSSLEKLLFSKTLFDGGDRLYDKGGRIILASSPGVPE
jgi:hypothetical protein